MFELMPFGRRERSLSDYFDQMEKNFFGNLDAGFSAIRTDVLDKGDHYLLRAELPGFDKEDIHIDLNGDRLEIRAEHNAEKEEKEKDSFVRRERTYGSFMRSFDVSGIRVEDIKANYKNGVLELELPKAAAVPPAAKRIDIQ